VGTIVPLLGTIFKARFVFVLFKLDPEGAIQFFRLFFLPEISSTLTFQLFSYIRESPACAKRLLRINLPTPTSYAPGRCSASARRRQGYEGQEASAGR
jgi:hypothetical protein